MTNTLITHRSIRKFQQKSIESEKLSAILNAACRASTTGNMQLYSVVITKNDDIKKKLWEVHFKQDMVMSAPAVFTFCADFNRFNKWCKLRDAEPGYDNFLSFYTASIDALLAAQNFCISAENQGLGICYLGTTTYMADKLVDILNLPDGVVPVTTVVAGYPDESPEQEDRLPLKGIVHDEVYKNYSDEEIEDIYKHKESLEKTKELLKINEKETLPQIFTDNRYKKTDNIHFSNAFLKVIAKQGFMNNS